MFFKKKPKKTFQEHKVVPESSPAGKSPDAQVEQDSYNYQDARDWTIERMALKEKQARLGWNVSALLIVLLLIVSTVAVVIAVKKRLIRLLSN